MVCRTNGDLIIQLATLCVTHWPGFWPYCHAAHRIGATQLRSALATRGADHYVARDCRHQAGVWAHSWPWGLASALQSCARSHPHSRDRSMRGVSTAGAHTANTCTMAESVVAYAFTEGTTTPLVRRRRYGGYTPTMCLATARRVALLVMVVACVVVHTTRADPVATTTTCSLPSAPAHGEVVCQPSGHNLTCILVCDFGFVAVGSASTHCAGGVWSATLGECDTPRTYLSMDSLPSLILSIATVAAAMIAAPLLPKGLSTALECVAVHRPAAHTALSHSLTPVCPPPPDASASVAGS